MDRTWKVADTLEQAGFQGKHVEEDDLNMESIYIQRQIRSFTKLICFYSFFVSPQKSSVLYLLTCVYILCATSPQCPLPGRTCFALLFSDFVAEKT
jgi:hypothetical protein